MRHPPTPLQQQLMMLYWSGNCSEDMLEQLQASEQDEPTLRLLQAVWSEVRGRLPQQEGLERLQGQMRYFYVDDQVHRREADHLLPRLPGKTGRRWEWESQPGPVAIGDWSTRPRGLIEVVEIPSSRESIREQLLQRGWRDVQAGPQELDCIKPSSRYGKGHLHLLIHWGLARHHVESGWEPSLRALLQRSEGQRPARLVTICAVGSPVWLLDCLEILRQGPLSQEQVRQEVLACGLASVVQERLSYLQANFWPELSVPGQGGWSLSVVERLGALESQAESFLPTSRPLWARLLLLGMDYLRLTAQRHQAGLPLMAPWRFLQLRWGKVSS